MNFLYGIFTGLLVMASLRIIQPEDPVLTGFIMFLVGTIHGAALMLYFLKKEIAQKVKNEGR